MVASQTDKALDFKKSVSEFENNVKLQLQQIQTKMQEQSRELEAIKLKQADVEIKVRDAISANAGSQHNSAANVTAFGNTQPSGTTKMQHLFFFDFFFGCRLENQKLRRHKVLCGSLC